MVNRFIEVKTQLFRTTIVYRFKKDPRIPAGIIDPKNSKHQQWKGTCKRKMAIEDLALGG